ncbi:MAG: Preprotein translocase subunit SecD [Microgenomates group bacterium GW2011_GWA2_46_7]|nr:MAG: Preprotein translocase subunit SecD [Microgenomates group bacterium GW2011_GWA2_46_7]
MRLKRNIFLIIILIAISLVIDAPKNYPINFSLFGKNISFVISSPTLKLGNFERNLVIKQGLDLQGGTEVTLEADMSALKSVDRQDALNSAREVISRRIDMYGVSEPTIKTVVSQDQYRILVALPGVSNPDEALSLIGQTAHLDFRELPIATDTATYADFIVTDLTGKDLQKATVTFNPQTGKPEIGLQFTKDGGDKFAVVTGRNIGKPVAIFLDEIPISVPTVQQKIEGGQAVINGEYTLDEAKNMVITLNAGALPVPIEIIKQQNIASTLGAKSVQSSLIAGGVGLLLVALFMILNYGWVGLIADLGLLIYGLFTLAVYKLIPITITLPGLAGFILSIGMAVDSNILVFERMKEEIRKGNDWNKSMELGFGKAWDSIKDANIATLITTFVLFNPFDWVFLNSSGMVRGFALTLFLGIAISLFTGIFITRNLLRALTHKSRGVSHGH